MITIIIIIIIMIIMIIMIIITFKEAQTAINTNITGAFALVRAFTPGMIERGYGHIVNVGSISADKVRPGNKTFLNYIITLLILFTNYYYSYNYNVL